MSFRTDRNNNPAAVITDLCKQAGLVLGTDYDEGDMFPGNSVFITAKLIGDPIALTIRIIDNVGYITKSGVARWSYINIPKFLWDRLDFDTKKEIVHYHYKHEGGTELEHLWSAPTDIGVHVGDSIPFGDKVG